MKLSERAVEVTLRIGSWSGQMYDNEVSDEIAGAKQASKRAGRYNKKLADGALLKGVNAAASAAKATHRQLTVPWGDKGGRLISTERYQDYTTVMRDRREHFERERDLMLTHYPEYINSLAVKDRLGSMYDLEDFPTPTDLADKYSFDIDVDQIVEVGDFRAELSEATTKNIIKGIEARHKAKLEGASNDVYKRVLELTERATERLRGYQPSNGGGQPEGKFHDSLIWNIRDLAGLMPALNVMEDPRIDKLQKDLMEQLACEEPHMLKKDEALRQSVADKAEAIAKRVKSLMA